MSSTPFKTLAAALALLVAVAACDSPEERLQSHTAKGQELLEAEEFTRARLEFRNALQIDPDHVPAIYGLSLIEEREGNVRAVGQLLRRVLEVDRRHLDATLRYGRLLLLAGQIDEALDHSNTALDLDPDAAGAHSFRAAVLLNLEDLGGAVTAANRAMEIDPTNVEAISVLAAERIRAGALREAIALLDRGLEAREQNVTLQLIKIGALSQLNQTEEIEQILIKLIEFYPDAQAFRQALVRFYLQTDRLDEAETQIRAIAESEPNNVELRLAVVRFLNAYRSPEAAEAELRDMVAAGGATAFTYRRALWDFFVQTEDLDSAKAVIAEAMETAETTENRLLAKNRMADILQAEGRPEEARQLVREILQEDSANSDALLMRSEFLIAEERYDDAILDLRTVLRNEPDSVRALVQLGRVHARQDLTDLAEDYYTRAFQASNRSPSVGLPLANFLASRGSLERAEDVLVQVLRQNPNNIAVYRTLAQIRIRREDWIGVEEVVAALKQLEDEEVFISQLEGTMLRGQDRFSEAIVAFERAQQAAPSALQPMVALVDAYVRNNEPQRAEDFLKTVIEASESNLLAQVLLAQFYGSQERFDEAEAMYRQVIEANPAEAFPYSDFAAFLVRQDRHDEAEAVIDAGLQNADGDVSLSLQKGGLLNVRADFDGLLSHFRDMYERNPDSPVIVNNYVSMLTDIHEDRETAERALEIAQPLMNSDVPQFQDTLGWIYYRLGRYEEATALLERAAQSLPDLAVVRYHLGMAYHAQNRPSAALAELQQAVELAESQPFPNMMEAQMTIDEIRAATGTETSQ